jgi:hypothetical protein
LSGSRLAGLLIAAVLGSFAAGVAVGLALPAAWSAIGGGAEPHHPDDQYLRRMTERYRLSKEQVRVLRMVLFARDQEIRKIFDDDPQRLPKPLDREYRDALSRANERIEHVLDPDQRRLYLADLAIGEDGSAMARPTGIRDDSRSAADPTRGGDGK